MVKVSDNHAEIFNDDNITKGFLQKVLIGLQDKVRISN